MNLFRRKSVTDLQAEALTDHSLKRALGALNLTLLGIGAIIGTGIFVLTGTVAALNSGPAVVLSFTLAGVASIFAALCYSEFASLVPMAGSAYTYGYATLGELIAWIIGWDLVLEYALGAVTVAIGWSVYVVLLFIVFAAHAVSAANWHPFIPPQTVKDGVPVAGEFGWSGVFTGAAIVFFAYIGFDAVSTAAQEAKNPQRDMPIG